MNIFANNWILCLFVFLTIQNVFMFPVLTQKDHDCFVTLYEVGEKSRQFYPYTLIYSLWFSSHLLFLHISNYEIKTNKMFMKNQYKMLFICLTTRWPQYILQFYNIFNLLCNL